MLRSQYALKWLARLVIGLTILALVWRSAGNVRIGEVVRSFSAPTLIGALAVFFLSWLLAAYKWALLIPNVPLPLVTRITFVSQFYGFFLPGQVGGEVFRAFMMARIRSDADRCIASVFVDRVTGIVGISIVALLGSMGSTEPPGFAFQAAFAGIGIAAATALLAVRGAFVERLVQRIAETLRSSSSGLLRRMGNFTARAHDALVAYASQGRMIAASVVLGTLFQALCILINYMLALSLDVKVTFFDLAWVQGVLAIALFLPITIGGIGVRELTFVGLLAVWNVPPEKSLVLSLAALALAASGALLGATLEARRLLTRDRAG